MAVKLGLRTRDLAGVIHPYPTFNDGPWNAALADVRAQLDAPLAAGAGRHWSSCADGEPVVVADVTGATPGPDGPESRTALVVGTLLTVITQGSVLVSSVGNLAPFRQR